VDWQLASALTPQRFLEEALLDLFVSALIQQTTDLQRRKPALPQKTRPLPLGTLALRDLPFERLGFPY
jgi:hypothetical protein